MQQKIVLMAKSLGRIAQQKWVGWSLYRYSLRTNAIRVTFRYPGGTAWCWHVAGGHAFDPGIVALAVTINYESNYPDPKTHDETRRLKLNRPNQIAGKRKEPL